MANEKITIVIDPILGRTTKVENQAKKAGENAGDNFSDGFRRESKKNLFGGLKSQFASLGNLAKTALNPVNIALAALGSGFAVKGIIDAGASIEKIGAQFETLLGSAAAAENQIKELTEFAAKTPFQLDGLAQTSAGLLAFGFASDTIAKRLSKIGDVASGSNSDIKEIGLIYGQIGAAGKLTGERLLQLQERAVPIGAALAKTMGVAQSEVKELVSAGKVGFKEFEEAFNSLSEAGGQFQGATARQSKTIGGLISTLKDNFFLLQASIAQAFGPTIKLAINEAISIFQTLGKFVESNRKQIQAGLQEMVNYFTSSVIPVLSFFGDLIKANFENAKVLANALIQIFSPAFFAGLNLANQLMGLLGLTAENSGGKVLTVFQNIGVVVNSIVIPSFMAIDRAASFVFNAVVVGINTIIAGFGKLGGAAGRLLEFFGAGGTVSTALVDFSESSALVLQDSIIPLADGMDRLFDPLVFEEKTSEYLAVLDETVNAAGPKFDKLVKVADKSLEKIGKITVNFGKVISSALAGATAQSIETLTKALVLGEKGFGTFAQAAAAIMGDLAVQLGKMFIATGLAMDALGKISPGAAIAAGIGLVAVGTILKSFSGGAASGVGGGVGAAGGGVGAGGSVDTSSFVVDQPDEEERQQPNTAVNLTINGDVLDSDETGTRIADLLNTAFEKEGVVLTQVGVA